MPDNFDKLMTFKGTVEKLIQDGGVNAFFGQEVLRFITIAGTVLKVEDFKLDEAAGVGERNVTHVLARSLLEAYFTIIYLYDDKDKIEERYDCLINDFKNDYRKLYNQLQTDPWKQRLAKSTYTIEPANTAWKSGNGLPDVSSMLTQIKNDYGDRLSYLYVLYRITSFDTHGRSHSIIFDSTFNKKCNFPVLSVSKAFELIAAEYVALLATIPK